MKQLTTEECVPGVMVTPMPFEIVMVQGVLWQTGRVYVITMKNELEIRGAPYRFWRVTGHPTGP